MKKYKVIVKLKQNVLDPEGKTISQAAARQGLEGIGSIRVGKYFEIDVDDNVSIEEVKKLAEKILVNPVIEVYELEV